MEINLENSLFFDSPIGTDTVSSFHGSFQELHVDQETVFWTELRPLEEGRSALIKKSGEASSVDLLPSMSIRTKIHEFGGGAFYAQKGFLVFFDAKTSSLWIQKEGCEKVCLAQNPLKRWADFSFSPDLTTLICVCEDHSKKEILNYLVSFNLDSRVESVFHQGFDFYASPQWSPDGKTLGFLFWNFPHMPWEQSFLKVVDWEKGSELFEVGSEKESIGSYIWLKNGDILFASDRNGFSNLYIRSKEGESILFEKEADFSHPLWVLGRKSFVSFMKEGVECIVAQYCEKGTDSLSLFNLKDRSFKTLELPYKVIRALDVGTRGIYFIGGSPLNSLSLVFLDLDTLTCEEICNNSVSIPEEFISLPEPVSTHSSLDEEKVFGFFYPPKNPNFSSQKLPPLIIKCHSGPTSHAQTLLSAEVQFWTSRGFAWLDVNYRGSTGYGRKYREALRFNWGVIDVQDCMDLAKELVSKGRVNSEALFTKGSSSGGFTALSMAAIFSDLRGCISSYGVTDLTLLLEDTHKFERYYLDSLIGKYDEFPLRYKVRSPSERANQIICPVLLLQGDQDVVVPLNQAEKLHQKLASSDLVVFKGEGHGFRKAETVQASLEAEVSFYKKVLR